MPKTYSRSHAQARESPLSKMPRGGFLHEPLGTESVALPDFMFPSALVNAVEERHGHRDAKRRSGVSKVRHKRSPQQKLATTFLPGVWCSDASITFAYSQFALGAASEDNGGGLPESFLLLEPTVALLLTHGEGVDVQGNLAGLKLEERELILCPVNDNREFGLADAGTHWSLLVAWAAKSDTRGLSPPSFHFAYYDSLMVPSETCLRHAEKLAGRLAGTRVKLAVAGCSKQRNGYDCGIYTLLYTEIILNAVKQAHQASPFVAEGAALWQTQLTAITSSDATQFRARYFKKAMRDAMDAEAKHAHVSSPGLMIHSR